MCAHEIAQGMLADAWRTRMNYAVISDNGPPPVPFSWQRMNLYGTTFNVRREREKAEAWIAAALMAGFTVYHSSRKGSSAPGRTYIKPA